MQHKGIIIILDGLGDRPVAALGGATPLEAANTPHLDELATAGSCGLVDPLFPGMPVSTHTGVGILFGLNTQDALHLPRGPVEAAGIGLAVMPGDIALRCNFATLQRDERGFTVVDRRAGRIHEGTHDLAGVLQEIPLGEGFTASVRPASGHRAVMHLSGPGPLPEISDTDPGADAGGYRVLTSYSLDRDNPLGEPAARALNRFIEEAYSRLHDHTVNRQRVRQGKLPANGLISRGAGAIRSIGNLLQHLNLRVAIIAGERTVIGLGRLFDFTVVTRPDFTSLPDTNLAAKVSAALAALREHDLVFLHVKAPDIFSHDHDPEGKKAFLEHADELLAQLSRKDVVIGVTADHSTDHRTGCHIGDPVPSILFSPTGRRDTCREYGEGSCTGGGLGRISGRAFLMSLLNEMGCLQNYRTEDSPFIS